MNDRLQNQTEPLLQCNDVSKSFRAGLKQTCILQNIRLTVQTGEIVVIHGRSGAGKSTLIHILTGLDRPSSGTVVLDHYDLNKLSQSKLARLRAGYMGIIFQNFNLIPTWTAQENVVAAMNGNGQTPFSCRQEAIQLLQIVGLGDHLDHLPMQLSIGQQQRVAISRALANDPRIIFADEPTGDLDPLTARDIVEDLIDLVRWQNITLIVTTHGTFPLDRADRCLCLKDGTLVK